MRTTIGPTGMLPTDNSSCGPMESLEQGRGRSFQAVWCGKLGTNTQSLLDNTSDFILGDLHNKKLLSNKCFIQWFSIFFFLDCTCIEHTNEKNKSYLLHSSFLKCYKLSHLYNEFGPYLLQYKASAFLIKQTEIGKPSKTWIIRKEV